MNRQCGDTTIWHQIDVAVAILEEFSKRALHLFIQVDALIVFFVLLLHAFTHTDKIRLVDHGEWNINFFQSAATDRISIAVIIRQFKQPLDIFLFAFEYTAIVIPGQRTGKGYLSVRKRQRNIVLIRCHRVFVINIPFAWGIRCIPDKPVKPSHCFATSFSYFAGTNSFSTA